MSCPNFGPLKKSLRNIFDKDNDKAYFHCVSQNAHTCQDPVLGFWQSFCQGTLLNFWRIALARHAWRGGCVCVWQIWEWEKKEQMGTRVQVGCSPHTSQVLVSNSRCVVGEKIFIESRNRSANAYCKKRLFRIIQIPFQEYYKNNQLVIAAMENRIWLRI